ncbi:FhaB protein [Actinobacillus equuli]|nr:FhaB protein [Actinobacillus equuli]
MNLLSTTDSQRNRSDNKTVVGVSEAFWKVRRCVGFGVEGAANVGKGHSNSESEVRNNTEINAEHLTINAKEKTTLKGAVANTNHLKLNTKQLHIESEQDIENTRVNRLKVA